MDWSLYLAKACRERRKKLKLTQGELARKIGWTSHVQVAKVECGFVPTLKKLDNLCRGLGVSVSQLLWEAEHSARNPQPLSKGPGKTRAEKGGAN